MKENEKVIKPWGYERVLIDSDLCVKEIFIEKRKRTSFHYHKNKHEFLLIDEGRINLHLDSGVYEYKAGEHVMIYPNQNHRIEAIYYTRIREVSSKLFGDVYRVEDDYGRGDEE